MCRSGGGGRVLPAVMGERKEKKRRNKKRRGEGKKGEHLSRSGVGVGFEHLSTKPTLRRGSVEC